MNRDDQRVIEGLNRQAESREDALLGSQRLGWKSGFGTEGAMDLLEIRQPLIGFLTTATLLETGSVVDLGGWGLPLLEPEVAVRVDAEIGPGASAEEAANAIGAAAAAIELVDLGAIESVEEILAGNIFHRHVLLGDFVDLEPGGLEEVRISVDANDRSAEPADPRDVIGDLGRVVAALADQAELFGETFRPGDAVITGAAMPPAPVQPGDRYTVKLSAGSVVSVDLS